jgi:hypothetical protein
MASSHGAEVVDLDPASLGSREHDPRRCGSFSSASTTRARSGTARLEPAVLPYSFSRPFAYARRTMIIRRGRSTSRHSAPKASSGRSPVPASTITIGPCVSSSPAAIASSSSQLSNGSISPGRGSGFFTCTAALSSIQCQRTAACSTWRSARCERYRLPSETDCRHAPISGAVNQGRLASLAAAGGCGRPQAAVLAVADAAETPTSKRRSARRGNRLPGHSG